MAKLSNNNKTNKPAIGNEIHSEENRLREDVYRSDIEKLQLFTRMLRMNALFKKAKIIHK